MGTSTQGLENFLNDYLKEDLKHLEQQLDIRNAEIMEFVQLKNTISTMREHLTDGFKTQMNIGGNLFMEAQISDSKTILLNVGKDVFVEFNLEEALTFIDFKIRILTKETEVIREASIKKRADIKLTLLCLAERENL